MATMLSSEIYYLIFYKLDIFTDSVFKPFLSFSFFTWFIKIKFKSEKIHFINT